MELLTAKEVIPMIKVSRNTLNELIKAGDFPAPIMLGKRKRHWRQADVLAWMLAR